MAVFFGLVTGWAFSAAAGFVAAGKSLGIMCVGHIFFILTPPEDVANALVKSGLPYHVAFVVGARMQFVPVLGRKARDVIEAQQARGIPLTLGWRAVRYYPAFLTPLLVQSFQLAEAMETRGFGCTERGFFEVYNLKRLDWALMLAGVITAGIWGWIV